MYIFRLPGEQARTMSVSSGADRKEAFFGVIRRTAAASAIAVLAFLAGAGGFDAGASGAACAAEYKYRVTVYSGIRGSISGRASWTREYSKGEHVFISLDELGFRQEDKKYYARGLRPAGRDNKETTGSGTLSFTAERDVDLVVAYGIKGKLVKYTVRYKDQSGKDLIQADTFYGMPGDRPTVAYRYIDGMTPLKSSITDTLSEDESKNVFTFKYKKDKASSGRGR